MGHLTSKELVQFRMDCLLDIDKLAEEVADRMMDILTSRCGENVSGLDVEMLGQLLCWEMINSLDMYFMNRVFELSDELDEEMEDEGDEEIDGESDVTEV
jgi:hypothetical protein